MTKKEKAMVQAHFAAQYSELRQVYGRYSDKKQRAFEYCLSEYSQNNGYDRRIPSHNAYTFSFSYLFDAGNKTFLRYITPSNNYTIMLEGK